MVKRTSQEGYALGVDKEFSASIAKSRNRSVDIAMSLGARWIMSIDSDMVFPEDALLRLMAHKEKIVSGLCVTRRPPFIPVARRKKDDGSYELLSDDELKSGRLIRGIDGVGGAFMLIDMEVFKALDKPFYAMPPFKDTVQGEDYFFCDKAISAGFEITIDTSLVIGHLGTYAYTVDDYFEYKKNNSDRVMEEIRQPGNIESWTLDF